MLSFTEFRRIRKTYIDFETRTECRLIWNKYIQMKKKMNTIDDFPCGAPVSITTDYISNYSLGNIAQPKFSFGMKQKEGNNPMNYATATVQAGTTETQDQRKYLANRLEDVWYKLEKPLYAAFGLHDDEPPTTPKELKKRIEDGKFTIKGLPKDGEEDEDDFYCYSSWMNYIQWRDPAKKADFDGYEAARKELRDLKQKALDIIKIDEPKAGLEAIKALEAWTPTGATN